MFVDKPQYGVVMSCGLIIIIIIIIVIIITMMIMIIIIIMWFVFAKLPPSQAQS
jgi:flagellar basal body-associated protein FliL